jgi:uncharacterized protein
MVAAGQAQAKPNHLGGQASPYLRRAVSQPVDWYPWSAEAFRRAIELDRPILLDVGAVWYPWCSFMDRDTYTNFATAEYINHHFVPIKVDFDAAPDLVAQLQRAQAILNLPAGLPLTSFITPGGKLTLAGDTFRPSTSLTNSHFARQRKRLSSVMPIKTRSPKNPFN